MILRVQGSSRALAQSLFSVAVGLLLGVTLLKFGNPIILHDASLSTEWDQGLGDGEKESFLLQPWPLSAAYWLFVFVIFLAFWNRSRAAEQTLTSRERSPHPSAAERLSPGSRWILAAPVLWLIWQCLAGVYSVNPALSRVTVAHFLACTGCFYLGFFAVRPLQHKLPLRVMVLIAFCINIAVGWYQHWIGFEETRRFFYQLPNWQEFPESFRAKLLSERIFGTLLYPNAFAGAILLYLPLCLGIAWELASSFSRVARSVVVLSLGGASLAALYWSGSKSAWLILLAALLMAATRAPLSRRLKVITASVLIVAGLAGFLVRYSNYFSRGAPSAVARLDYWKAASQVFREHPVFGSGPGSFMVEYSKRKAPQSEMARLVHNDYLQQASDSGAVGFLAYLAATATILLLRYRQRMGGEAFLVWLGAVSLAAQAFVEFPLYIPALAWPYFLLVGWLCPVRNRSGNLP